MIINKEWVNENYHGEKHFVIPEGATEIGDYAFIGCESLRSVVIPDGVTEIGKDVFEGCNNLIIKCSPDSTAEKYAKENNIKYEYI